MNLMEDPNLWCYTSSWLFLFLQKLRFIGANFPDRCMFGNIFDFVDDIEKPVKKRKLAT